MSSINTQRQKELFEEFIIREKRKGRFLGVFRFKKPIFPQHRLNISLSYEALIIVLIGLVLTISIIFSLGVERGRNLEFAEASPKGEQAVTETELKEPQTQSTEKPVEVQKQPEIKPEGLKKITPVPSEEKPYTIQVASFKTRSFAEQELFRLKNIGYPSDVLKKGNYFIVCVGVYAKEELAQQTLKDLRLVYKDCYVRKR